MDLPEFVDMLVSKNIILTPDWELKLFLLGKSISTDRLGYPRIWVGGKNGRYWLLHRIVANAPESSSVDHINRDPTDCRTENLRLATHQQNMMNRGLSKNNKSRVPGVSFDSKSALWSVKLEHLGVRYRKKFKCFEDAVEYRKCLEMKHFGHFSPV